MSVRIAHYQDLVAESGFKGEFDFLTVRGVRVDRQALLTLKLFLKDGGRLLLFGSVEDMEKEELRGCGFTSIKRRKLGITEEETIVFIVGE